MTEAILPTFPPEENLPTAAILRQSQAEQQQALASVITRIRESLDLETIFKTTAIEVRNLLKVDRVGILQLDPQQNWQGEFVSEAVGAEWTSALKVKVNDHCFGERFVEAYQQGRVNAIADIDQNNFDDCYLAVLKQFQVRANVVAPLLNGRELWGLLCIHQCGNAREWTASEIEFVGQIAQHLSAALQHSQLLVQAQLQTQQQKALTGVIARIRESLDLDTIFKTTATEVRKLLKTDRVAVFQLDPQQDWEGEFISEAVGEDWSSTMAVKVYDPCFGTQVAECYRQGRVNVITDIYEQDLSACYLQVLKRLQVRANIVAPLLKGKDLWGLLCIHQCSTARRWESYEIDFVNQIAQHLSVALSQIDYLNQVQSQSAQLAKIAEQARIAEQQKAIATTINKIRQSLDLETIFHTATQEVKQLLKADRVALYRFNADWSGEFVSEAVDSSWDSLLEKQSDDPALKANVSECSLKSLARVASTDTHLQQTQGEPFNPNLVYRVCSDIYQAGFSDCYIQILESYQARAYAIVAIYREQKLWGLLAAYQNASPRQWQDDEVYLLTQISTQLGVALQQAEYLKQMAKAAERQRALSNTVEKIRQSLDIETIFQTTTQEVRQLLEVERVAIYRFYPNWSGEFVADSIVTDWVPIIRPQPIASNAVLPTDPSGQYPRNETFVPILQGEKLWGLLVAYQTSQPRYWTDEEINLLAQVGVQLGIALQQAELLKQTQQQAAELSQALQEVKQSQSRLIQGEKMASLGQLVAGVAHEINNPVNFIYGNLSHISNYTENLLTMLRLYQEHYPEPVEAIQQQAEEIALAFTIDDLPKTLSSMHLGVDRIRQIVLSLRTFSRLDEAQVKPVNIHEGIDSTLLILQHRLKVPLNSPQIQIVKEYGDLPLVDCYPAQLNQVFMNILSNAIDALEESHEHSSSEPLTTNRFTSLDTEVNTTTKVQPKIQIRTEIVGDHAIIRIIDNGPGMTEEVRERIFDPFYTTKAVGKGTGLGLSISYQIVTEKHHGHLRCFSQLGQGTEFWIEIPIRQAIT